MRTKDMSNLHFKKARVLEFEPACQSQTLVGRHGTTKIVLCIRVSTGHGSWAYVIRRSRQCDAEPKCPQAHQN